MKLSIHQNSTRRSFLKNSTLGILSSGLTGSNPLAYKSEENRHDPPKIKDYCRLGRTGAMVSDIGSGVPYSEGVLNVRMEWQHGHC